MRSDANSCRVISWPGRSSQRLPVRCSGNNKTPYRCWNASLDRAPGSAILLVVPTNIESASSPRVTSMRVIPVAGRDSMLLNLSGAHAPFFTRNVVLLTDDAGHTGAGEVPGGEKIRRVLEESRALVVGQPIGTFNAIQDAVL